MSQDRSIEELAKLIRSAFPRRLQGRSISDWQDRLSGSEKALIDELAAADWEALSNRDLERQRFSLVLLNVRARREIAPALMVASLRHPDFANSDNLAGAFFWELSEDDFGERHIERYRSFLEKEIRMMERWLGWLEAIYTDSSRPKWPDLSDRFAQARSNIHAMLEQRLA